MTEETPRRDTDRNSPFTIHHSPFTIHHSPFPNDDLLWRHLKTVPAFRALLRAVEARFYHQLELPQPLLDVGCGDGHFARMTFSHPLAAGIDPWWGPLRKAQRSEQYHLLAQGNGDRLPFPDATFASAISNSVLEHIPEVEPVLAEVSRVLQPNGRFVITMPSHYFTQNLGGAALFETLGLDPLAEQYRHFFNAISRHAHTDPPETWATRLAAAGLTVERWQYYFSTDALRALEIGHIQGLPSAVLHALTGHWIIAPWRSNLRRTEQWLRPFYEEAPPERGAYLLIVARKESDGPLAADLPPPRPYTITELEAAERPSPLPSPSPEREMTPERPPEHPPSHSPTESETSAESETRPLLTPRRWRQGGVLLALLLALLGQFAWRGDPPDVAAGLRWWGAAAALLWLLLWQKGERRVRWRWPKLGQIERRRWLYVPALLLAMFGGSLAAPLPALALWLGGAGLGIYALWPAARLQLKFPTRKDWGALALLGGGALLLRFIWLTEHPFILNGTEASIGLDALNVVRGGLRDPFAAGWLTNPTLPAFLLALPVGLLGPSTLSVRLLSPLAGSLTVAAIYLVGGRLWNRTIGLLAAALLAGSHLHLHYSRLGLTNVWDPLLVLLTLALIWRGWQGGENGRFAWLGAGITAGLSAYLYTASHLLPLMLLALFAIALIGARRRLWAQRRSWLAALLLAGLIALPQLLHYRANPGQFTARAEALGILPGQSGWLAAEAARTGQSQLAILGQQAARAALAFNAYADRSSSYGATIPLFTLGPALFLALGAALALARWRRLRAQLLLVWLGVTIVFGGVLLQEPPQSHRLLLAAPAAVLLAAIALERLGRWLWPADKRPARRLLLLAVALLFIATEIWFYFGAFRREPTFADRNTEVAYETAVYLDELGEDWTAYFYGPPAIYVSFPTIPFLVSDTFRAGQNLFDAPPPPQDDLPLPAAPTARRVYIFLPERSGELESIQMAYPDGELRRVDGRYASPLFLAYEVPAP